MERSEKEICLGVKIFFQLFSQMGCAYHSPPSEGAQQANANSKPRDTHPHSGHSQAPKRSHVRPVLRPYTWKTISRAVTPSANCAPRVSARFARMRARAPPCIVSAVAI